MRNFIQEGKTLGLIAPYALASGAGFQVGAIFAIASDAAAIGEEVQGVRHGVYTLPKTAAQAWTVGQKIYWDDTNKRCDSIGSVGLLIGAAVAVASNPSTTGSVMLAGTVQATLEGAQNAIADIATANASDAATAAALANSCKTTINTLLAELRIIGVILP